MSPGDSDCPCERTFVDVGLQDAFKEFLFRHGDRLARPPDEIAFATLARIQVGDSTFCLVRMPGDQDQQPLTAKQREIALLIALGLSNKEVARRLGVSPATIASHLVRIFRKMKVDSRAALASKIPFLS